MYSERSAAVREGLSCLGVNDFDKPGSPSPGWEKEIGAPVECLKPRRIALVAFAPRGHPISRAGEGPLPSASRPFKKPIL